MRGTREGSREPSPDCGNRLTLVPGEGVRWCRLDAIMKDVGLTHRGFYGHFTSKEDLAAAAVPDALEERPNCRGDIRISPILFLVICPKAISQIGNAIFAATDARPRPGQCAAGACAKGVIGGSYFRSSPPPPVLGSTVPGSASPAGGPHVPEAFQ